MGKKSSGALLCEVNGRSTAGILTKEGNCLQAHGASRADELLVACSEVAPIWRKRAGLHGQDCLVYTSDELPIMQSDVPAKVQPPSRPVSARSKMRQNVEQRMTHVIKPLPD